MSGITKKKPTVTDLVTLIRSHRFNWQSEEDFQEGIRRILKTAKIRFRKEVALGSAGRIDFLVDGIGIEIKVQESVSKVAKQLHDYAGRTEVTELLLVTTKASHRRLPSTLRGKRLTVLCLWEAAL